MNAKAYIETEPGVRFVIEMLLLETLLARTVPFFFVLFSLNTFLTLLIPIECVSSIGAPFLESSVIFQLRT